MSWGRDVAIPSDFAATVGGADCSVSPPWRATYTVSLGIADGLRLAYAIDRTAVLPWTWRVPVAVDLRDEVARLVLSTAILSNRPTEPHRAAVAGVWLGVTAFGRSAHCALTTVRGGLGLVEAFHALIPAPVWRELADRRAMFVDAHAPTSEWDGGEQHER